MHLKFGLSVVYSVYLWFIRFIRFIRYICGLFGLFGLSVDYSVYSVYLCTKCLLCDAGYPLTVQRLLFTKIIISSVHGAFSLSVNVHALSIETQKFLLRKT